VGHDSRRSEEMRERRGNAVCGWGSSMWMGRGRKARTSCGSGRGTTRGILMYVPSISLFASCAVWRRRRFRDREREFPWVVMEDKELAEMRAEGGVDIGGGDIEFWATTVVVKEEEVVEATDGMMEWWDGMEYMSRSRR
jgi:hypothetical protein